jgi:cobalt/nickel transport system permease protein
MWAVSAGAVAYSTARIKKTSAEQEDAGGGLVRKASLMAMSGAFVFAAQMINFAIPGTGSSGHIGGGMLLACLLGSYPAMLTITSVLAIQALFFADGGLLALGCNIFNMGVVPCLLVYPLVVKPLFQKRQAAGARGGFRYLTAGCVLGVMLALPLGAFFVVLETLASRVTALPFSTFLLLMLPIHVAIAVGEAAVTAAIVAFVASNGSDVIESAVSNAGVSKADAFKRILVILGVCALVTGGVLSLFASSYPDGLEWSIEKITGSSDMEAEGAAFERAAALQEAAAFMPDYDYRAAGEEGSASGATVAGVVGSLITCVVVGALGAALYLLKRKKTPAL